MQSITSPLDAVSVSDREFAAASSCVRFSAVPPSVDSVVSPKVSAALLVCLEVVRVVLLERAGPVRNMFIKTSFKIIKISMYVCMYVCMY